MGRGFSVRSPDYINERGTGTRREIDVSIRGMVGSTEILIIVECRQRKERQGVEWIEQIASKARAVEANKAIAVSGSGFTGPARLSAPELGVDLRELRDLSLETAVSWLFEGRLLMKRHLWYMNSAGFDLASEPNVPAPEPFEPVGIHPERHLFDSASGDIESISDIWHDYLSRRGITAVYNGVGTERVNRRLNIEIAPSLEVRLQTGGTRYLLKTLRLDFDLWTEVVSVPCETFEYRGETGLATGVRVILDSEDTYHHGVITIVEQPPGSGELQILFDRGESPTPEKFATENVVDLARDWKLGSHRGTST